MKRKLFKNAFTLIELIVASMLVVIVVLGIFSISSVLTNNNMDYGQRYLVKAQTQATLNHILGNASLAVGSALTNDKAILIGSDMGAANNNSFCIHQKSQAGVDSWLCYTFDNNPASLTYQQISYCNKSYTGGVYRGADGACTATATFLGSAFSITSIDGTALPSSPYFVANSSQLYFGINILNCLNNAAASCNAGATPGTSSDPANNPQVQLSGTVIPSQVSTN